MNRIAIPALAAACVLMACGGDETVTGAGDTPTIAAGSYEYYPATKEGSWIVEWQVRLASNGSLTAQGAANDIPFEDLQGRWRQADDSLEYYQVLHRTFNTGGWSGWSSLPDRRMALRTVEATSFSVHMEYDDTSRFVSGWYTYTLIQ